MILVKELFTWEKSLYDNVENRYLRFFFLKIIIPPFWETLKNCEFQLTNT